MPNKAVEVKHLTVRFGDFVAVNDISFEVKQGEIFGFLGANGAGKTTTIRVLCGLLNPSSGTAQLSGIEQNAQNSQKIKAKVGYMSQKFTLYDDLSIAENLAFNASLRKLKPDYFQKRRDDLLRFISFERDLGAFVKDLPGGVKQQISLVVSLLHDPEIIFLDEPTAGVTPASRALFWNLIRQLAQNQKTVFVTTHYMDEAEQCGRVALMRQGALIALDSPQNLKRASFPGALYELEPQQKLSYTEIEQYRKNEFFDFFEPYGLRFHASFVSSPAAEKFKKDLAQEFNIKAIEASLEDVFIRLVEGVKT